MPLDKHRIIILCILIIAAAFRIAAIGSESYWVDESISIKQAQQDYKASFEMIKRDIHMPLYTVLLHEWVKIFGTTEIASRLLSAIFGIMSVVAIYLLSRKLFSKQVALWTAAIMAVSPIFIYYSQETRMYSLFILLTIASYYYFISFLQEKNSKSLVLYFISTLMLMYSYVFAFLVLLSQNIYILHKKCRYERDKISHANNLKIFKNDKIIHWTLCQAILLAAFIPWINILIIQVKNSINIWISQPNFGVVLRTFIDFFGNILTFSIFLMCMLMLFNKRNYAKLEKDKILFLLIWIVIPFILVIIYSMTLSPLYNTRYMLFTLPAIIILFAYVIEIVTEKKKYVANIIIAIILISSLVSTIIQAVHTDKDDWRSAASFVKENLRDDEFIFVDPLYHQDPLSYYYSMECFNNSDMDDIYTCNFDKHMTVSVNWKAECCNDNTRLTSNDGSEMAYYNQEKILLISNKPELAHANDSALKYFSAKRNYTLLKEYGNIKIYRFE